VGWAPCVPLPLDLDLEIVAEGVESAGQPAERCQSRGVIPYGTRNRRLKWLGSAEPQALLDHPLLQPDAGTRAGL
jgi:hypothetical protein